MKGFFYFKIALGCPEGIEPSMLGPQPSVLPLNYGHPDAIFHTNFLDSLIYNPNFIISQYQVP